LRAIRTLLTLMLAANVLALAEAALVRVLRQNVTGLDLPGHPVVPAGLRATSVHAYLTEPSVLQTIAGLGAHGLGYYLATLPMIVFARRLVDHATDHSPFTPVMAAGLRRLGVVVLAGGAAAEIVRVLSAVALQHLAGVDGTLPLSGFGLWWLPMGLVVLAFAQVIDHGCALRAELDQVV
jgi:hypothetical protein